MGTGMSDGFQIVNIIEGNLDEQYADTPLHGVAAFGRRLFCSDVPLTRGHLGVDLLRVPSGIQFPLHVHPGNHLLYVVRGRGTVTFGGEVYTTKAGDLMLIDAEIEHAVGASSFEEQFILAFGAPHEEVDSPNRMRVVEDAADVPV